MAQMLNPGIDIMKLIHNNYFTILKNALAIRGVNWAARYIIYHNMCGKLCCGFGLFLLIGLSTNALAQGKNVDESRGFVLSLIIGANLSQLDGDNLSGYSSLGLRSGIQISNTFSSKMGFSIGLLYDAKGSRESFGLGNGASISNIKLRYLSVPVDFFFSTDYNDLIERNRIRFHFGMSVSRLFGINTNIQQYSILESEFNNFDLSPYIGFTYLVSRSSGIHLRFERSINNVLDSIPSQNIEALSSFMFSLQYQYSL